MYQTQEVENYLRNYTSLSHLVMLNGDEDLHLSKVDLDTAMLKLRDTSYNLYSAIMGVFVYGNSIQSQAKAQKISKRQMLRRLDDGLHMLTMIMNGEVL